MSPERRSGFPDFGSATYAVPGTHSWDGQLALDPEQKGASCGSD